MPKAQAKTKIRNLGVGGVFVFERKDQDVGTDNRVEFWKIIGRPTYAGQKNPVTKKKEYVVLCTYVKKNKDDQNAQPDKSFNIDYEVIVVKRSAKDFSAIDQRDQPKQDGKPVVSPIRDLAKELGQELSPDLDEDEADKELEEFINEDAEEEAEDGD